MEPPLGWRLLETAPASGAFNMAVDEALMESVRCGDAPTLRVYRWSPPCLSLGRNQPGRGRYDVARLRASGVDVVRRPTGGRAVLHDEDLTYAVVAPVRTFKSARGAYRAINTVLTSALGQIGVEASVQGIPQRPAPVLSTAPCFAEPAEGEVVARGRKLIGSAQVCVNGVLLQHGSMPMRRSPALSRLPADIAHAIDGRPALLESLAGLLPSWDELTAAIAAAWAAAVGPLEPRALDVSELERVEILEANYGSDGWTWRR